MAAGPFNIIERFMNLSWLTGPIFDKELRVSSRRTRNYVLRSVYLFFLMSLLYLVWIRAIDRRGSGLYTVSRMAEAGKMVIVYMVWFQFCVTQVVAVIMLSTSISDEIYNRTLGLLMTTPIGSFQIVMGKLLSKLLQLILLLAISLPVLALIRVLGGVPWRYVVSSLCITLTTMVFFASLSLLFSIFTRRAYVVVIITILTLFLCLAVLPYLTGVLWFTVTGDWPGDTLTSALFYHNPYGVMLWNSMTMLSPRGAGGAPSFYWPLHCGIVMALSVLVLSAAVVSVRRVALREATGQLGSSSRKQRPHKSAGAALSGRQDCFATARRIVGPPVVWKEMRFPLLGKRRKIAWLAVTAGLVLILVSYYLCSIQHILDDTETHIVYALIYLGLGGLFTIVIPSTCITGEKEARSWPLLLTTSLNDREILLGKLAGALRRCLPTWGLLIGHVVVFSLADIIHPIAIIQTGLLVTWLLVLLCCSGIYFSSRCRRTATAVVMNFIFALGLWVVVWVLLLLWTNTGARHMAILEAYMDAHPLRNVCAILDAAAGRRTLGSYGGPGFRGVGVFWATLWMLICAAGYVLLGAIFAWRAQRRFRRNIF